MTSFDFNPPELWSFPPFFTIQPVQATRIKQLDIWKQLILEYHMTRNLHTMTLTEFPYFENQSIDRKLSREGVLAVISHLIASGNAEWEDDNRSRARIMWRTAEAVASDIYSWVTSNGYIGTVFTVYELLNGEEYSDSGFGQTDPYLFKRALYALEKQNKCTVIEGANSDEDGVKFL
mmetsp:Transcript_10873/g.16559  ORF Transcript_10873/g.16559 Transcript_10873/m.16559 type:complete len:177 (+) Transcript_10873:56-586(+)